MQKAQINMHAIMHFAQHTNRFVSIFRSVFFCSRSFAPNMHATHSTLASRSSKRAHTIYVCPFRVVLELKFQKLMQLQYFRPIKPYVKIEIFEFCKLCLKWRENEENFFLRTKATRTIWTVPVNARMWF